MDGKVIDEVWRSSTRFLTGHYRKRPHQMLSELAETIDPDASGDAYGRGKVMADFENEIATLLGKEAAVFMPSGTMAQQIALRIWSERKGRQRVAFHPTCHLERYEQQGYRELHHLQGILVGDPDHLMRLSDLQAVAQPLAALLVELPQREIGGQLPTWEELVQLTSWAREQGIALHLDGARLWQCGSFYQRSFAEIAALFESVYVSFYKDLGGITGAVLAGPADFIAESRIWQRRHGGNLIQMYPYVLSARLGMREHLDRMPEYYDKARSIAAALSVIPEIAIVPSVPQTNMMHLYLRGDSEAIMAAAMDVSSKTGIFTMSWLKPSILPDQCSFEWTVGAATLDIPDDEIVSLFWEIFAQAAKG